MTDEEIIVKFHDDIRLRGLSPATLKEYTNASRVFFRFTVNKNLEDITEKDIREFLKYLLDERNVCPACVGQYNSVHIYSALRSLIGFTTERNLNYRMIPRLKIIRDLPEIMSVYEVHRLFDVGKTVLPFWLSPTLISFQDWHTYRPDHPDGYLFQGS
jgi:site-specific recombinase XerD